MSNKQLGLTLAFVTAIISGISIFINKLAVGIIQPPVTFTFSKNLIAGLFFISVILFSKKYHQIRQFDKKQFLKLFFVGLIGGSLPFYLYFTGLEQVSAINAAMIHKTLAVGVILFTFISTKKIVSLQLLGSLVLILLGNFLVGGFSGFKFSSAEFMILFATVLWAIENMISKQILIDIDPVILAASRLFVGSLILIPFVSSPKVAPNTNITQLAVYLSTIILLVFYNFTWYQSLKRISVITATVVLSLSTIITNILSAVFITHNLSQISLFQTILLILGAILLTKFSLKSTQQKDFSASLVQ